MGRHDAALYDLFRKEEYAYLTVYEGDSMVCEGTVRSLSKILDLDAIRFRSFFVMHTEDGGVEIEACL